MFWSHSVFDDLLLSFSRIWHSSLAQLQGYGATLEKRYEEEFIWLVSLEGDAGTWGPAVLLFCRCTHAPVLFCAVSCGGTTSVVMHACLWLGRLICLILESGCIYKPHSPASAPLVGEKGDFISWPPYSFVWFLSWLRTWSWKRSAIYWALSDAKRSLACTVAFCTHNRQYLIHG